MAVARRLLHRLPEASRRSLPSCDTGSVTSLSKRVATWIGALALMAGPPLARAQSPSLPPEWEVRDNLQALREGLARLRPLLSGVKPEDWVAKGAPAAYQAQLRSLAEELGFLTDSLERLAAEPERLTLALEVYLRSMAVEAMLESLSEGVRKYQNPALADLLKGAYSETAPRREKLRSYLVQLASAKEAELKIMHEEAQRCRTMLLRTPPRK